ncbi:hypothetical protein BH20ACT6_BH20ACT6_17540 [soil metagenome]
MTLMSGSRSRADKFVDAEHDPRENGPSPGDERATLVEYLRAQRLTLELKCSGLDAAELARRSVEPSTMSLLGSVRHLAEVEWAWFRRRMSRLIRHVSDPWITERPAPTGQPVQPSPIR